MKATVVVDNIGNDELKGEWGLCIYIEYKNEKILLDAGASGLFLENAKKMNIPLEKLEYAVLSHGHYDHANGMKEFFRINNRAKFYLRDGCRENCYKKKWTLKKYIGLPKGVLEEYKDRIVLAPGDYTIAEGVSLIPHKTQELALIGKRENMYLREGNRWRPDDFSHEQSLVFDTPDGLVIFNSCSHGGADNIINEVTATFPDKKVLAFIGGFHLYNKSEEVVRDFAKRLKETGVKHVYTGHCTGKTSYKILKEELGDVVNQLRVGLEMEF
ncbi:MAG: MBL fold metallo-hydrolase [Eubacterium sp.]|nr:MBL fold metallo-hydrolase [Eubacterium sp.]